MGSVRWQWLASVVLVLLLLPSVHAAFSIDVKPIDNDIYRNETAVFEVSVQSFQDAPIQIQAYTLDPGWHVRTVPINLVIPARGTDRLLLYLRPTAATPYGTQGVALTFKDVNAEGVTIKKSVLVGVHDTGMPGKEYQPAVNLDLKMPYDVDPREEIPLRLELRNRNSLDIKNLSITLSSPHFTREVTMELGPLSEKTRDVQGVRINPLTAPGEGEVVVKVFYQGSLVTQLTKNYKILEYTTIEQNTKEDSFFFKNTRTIAVHNDGNVQTDAAITVPTSFLKRLFVSSSLDYSIVDKDGRPTILWQVPLTADESATFTYTENYRILVFLLLLALAGWLTYYLLRSPLVVTKEAVGVTRKGEGVSQIKVRIFLRNRSPRLVRTIQVMDRVPSLAEVIKAEAPGSITPAKVAKSEKQGTLLRWDLDVLEPYEERVLTYHAKSKLKIIGRMSLPNSKVRFVSNGKERVVYSNNIEIVERFKDK